MELKKQSLNISTLCIKQWGIKKIENIFAVNL